MNPRNSDLQKILEFYAVEPTPKVWTFVPISEAIKFVNVKVSSFQAYDILVNEEKFLIGFAGYLDNDPLKITGSGLKFLSNGGYYHREKTEQLEMEHLHYDVKKVKWDYSLRWIALVIGLVTLLIAAMGLNLWGNISA